MSQPFFSVVIPVYNRAEALRHAIASVQAQTCQDFEIVVVDDGSRDDPAATVAAINLLAALDTAQFEARRVVFIQRALALLQGQGAGA